MLVCSSSEATVKVVSAKGQFICYHPPEETFYQNSKVMNVVYEYCIVCVSCSILYTHHPLQPLKPQDVNKGTKLKPVQVTWMYYVYA